MLVAEGRQKVCVQITKALANEISVMCVSDAENARNRVGEGFSIVLIDVDLPGGSLSVVDEFNTNSPDTSILLYGEDVDVEILEKAINKRVAGFIRLPFNFEVLRRKIIWLRESHTRNKELADLIVALRVDAHTRNDALLRARRAGLLALARLAEYRDTDTGMHVERVAAFSEALALRLRDEGVYADRLNDEFINSISIAAALHDIGKVAVPDLILHKPGTLTSEEFELMKTHCVKGWEVIEAGLKANDGEDPEMNLAAEVIRHHHEKWDGSGYPDGLAGEDIPLAARIVAVIDAYDAMRSSRVYNPARSSEKAIAEIHRCIGTHFDPKIAKVFLKHVDAIETLGRTLRRVTARWKK